MRETVFSLAVELVESPLCSLCLLDLLVQLIFLLILQMEVPLQPVLDYLLLLLLRYYLLILCLLLCQVGGRVRRLVALAVALFCDGSCIIRLTSRCLRVVGDVVRRSVAHVIFSFLLVFRGLAEHQDRVHLLRARAQLWLVFQDEQGRRKVVLSTKLLPLPLENSQPFGLLEACALRLGSLSKIFVVEPIFSGLVAISDKLRIEILTRSLLLREPKLS